MRPHQWCFGKFRLDADNGCLWDGEKRLALRPKTFAVLMSLVTHAGRLVTKEELLDEVWPNTMVGDGVLKTSIRDLRRMLGETSRTPQFIATEYRRGYRFIAPVTTIESAPSDTVLPNLAPSQTEKVQVVQPGSSRRQPAQIVARETELSLLHQGLVSACDHQLQLIFVTGEAGIGKTALIDAFLEQISTDRTVWIAQGQCVEQYGTREAYFPLLAILRQLCRGAHGERVLACLHHEAPSWLLQMPALLPRSAYQELQQQYGGATQERMLRELAEAIESLSTIAPLLLVLEDLHWSDTATIDWLNFMANRRSSARLLILATYRPIDAMQQEHPVNRMSQELQRRGHAAELCLNDLTETGVSAYLTQHFEAHTFPDYLTQMLTQRTSGNPFFLVTVVEELIRQRVFVQQGSSWTFVGNIDAVESSLPHSVQYLIEAQLQQLSSEEQELLAAASVVGADFTSSMVAPLLGQGVEYIEAQSDALVRRGQFVASNGTLEWPNHTVSAQYQFLHVLHHEVVYERVPVNRKIRWHQQMGDHLEILYGEQVWEIAAALAEHFVRGRDAARALHYLHRAGEQAVQRRAYQEAKAHFTRGLDMLAHLPENPERDRLEIRLRTALGPILMTIGGYGSPKAIDNYTRAHELCQEGDGSTDRFPVLWGVWQGSNARDRPQKALTFAQQIHAVAQTGGDPIQVLQGHHAMWTTLMHCAQYDMALRHMEEGKRLYRPQQHHIHAVTYGVDDPGVCCLTTGSGALWYLGYADQAIEWAEEGLTLAKSLEHPFSLCYALYDTVQLFHSRYDFSKTFEHLEMLIKVSSEHGFQSFMALAEIEWGSMLIWQQQDDAGIARIQNGLDQFKAMGTLYQRPWFRLPLATAYGRLGQIDKGLAEIEHGLRYVGDTGQVKTSVELYRVQGTLHLLKSVPNEREAEWCFQQSLELSRHQKARFLELRTSVNLAQLWYRQSKKVEALALLESIYASFTEGYDTGDMRHARRLLQEWGSLSTSGTTEADATGRGDRS